MSKAEKGQAADSQEAITTNESIPVWRVGAWYGILVEMGIDLAVEAILKINPEEETSLDLSTVIDMGQLIRVMAEPGKAVEIAHIITGLPKEEAAEFDARQLIEMAVPFFQASTGLLGLPLGFVKLTA